MAGMSSLGIVPKAPRGMSQGFFNLTQGFARNAAPGAQITGGSGTQQDKFTTDPVDPVAPAGPNTPTGQGTTIKDPGGQNTPAGANIPVGAKPMRLKETGELVWQKPTGDLVNEQGRNRALAGNYDPNQLEPATGGNQPVMTGLGTIIKDPGGRNKNFTTATQATPDFSKSHFNADQAAIYTRARQNVHNGEELTSDEQGAMNDAAHIQATGLPITPEVGTGQDFKPGQAALDLSGEWNGKVPPGVPKDAVPVITRGGQLRWVSSDGNMYNSRGDLSDNSKAAQIQQNFAYFSELAKSRNGPVFQEEAGIGTPDGQPIANNVHDDSLDPPGDPNDPGTDPGADPGTAPGDLGGDVTNDDNPLKIDEPELVNEDGSVTNENNTGPEFPDLGDPDFLQARDQQFNAIWTPIQRELNNRFHIEMEQLQARLNRNGTLNTPAGEGAILQLQKNQRLEYIGSLERASDQAAAQVLDQAVNIELARSRQDVQLRISEAELGLAAQIQTAQNILTLGQQAIEAEKVATDRYLGVLGIDAQLAIASRDQFLREMEIQLADLQRQDQLSLQTLSLVFNTYLAELAALINAGNLQTTRQDEDTR